MSIKDLFIYIPYKDQFMEDVICIKGKTIEELMEITVSNNYIVGFNTLGYMKKRITILTDCEYFTNENDGIYILKTAVFTFIPNMTQIGYDLNHLNIINDKLMVEALLEEECVGFTNDGYLKNKIENLTYDRGGIYLKTKLIKIDYVSKVIDNIEEEEYNKYFENLFKSDVDPLYSLINPLSPYMICDHYISSELDPFYYKSGIRNFEGNKNTLTADTLLINYNLIKGNDLLKNKNIEKIKDGDIVQCQVEYLEFFYKEVLQKIDKKIVLFTSQQHYPQINRSELTDIILRSDKILLWVSQNPIYSGNKKYMGFPYGFSQFNVGRFYNYLRGIKIEKTRELSNMNCAVHSHLPEEHIRKKYQLFGEKSGKKLEYEDYLDIIASSKFVFSPSGDRNDCHRHYEIIALDGLPISDIRYYDIFGKNMIYSNGEEMVKMLENNKCNFNYFKPNKDLITIEYWIEKIKKRIR